MALQIEAFEGLLETEQPEPVETGEVADIRAGVAAVGVDLQVEIGERSGDGPDRLQVPSGADLHLDPGKSLFSERSHLDQEGLDGARLAHDSAKGNRPTLDAQNLGQAPALGPE